MASPSKTSIDQLGDRLRSSDVSDADLRLLDNYRRSFAEAYEHVISTVRTVLGFEPTGRPAKSTTSITEKLQRETIRLTQMQDIAGCRLVVPDIQTQEDVVDALRHALDRVAIVDRRKHPSHGYRAVHVIATVGGKSIEIQVRTALQHLWAEFSEKLADVVDPDIKYGGGPPETRSLLSEYSGLVGDVERFELDTSKTEPAGVADLKKRLRGLLEREVARLVKRGRDVVSD